VKHIVTAHIKYDEDRHGMIEMEDNFDTAMGHGTKDNSKIIQFLKSTKLYNNIFKKIYINKSHTISTYL